MLTLDARSSTRTARDCVSLFSDSACGSIPRLRVGYSVLCDSTVIYQCPTGYLLHGAPHITCDPDTHQWSPQPPTCLGLTFSLYVESEKMDLFYMHNDVCLFMVLSDINECSTESWVCPPHLQCFNTPGSYTCTGEHLHSFIYWINFILHSCFLTSVTLEPVAPPLSASSIVASVMSVLVGVALIALILIGYHRCVSLECTVKLSFQT